MVKNTVNFLKIIFNFPCISTQQIALLGGWGVLFTAGLDTRS